MPTGPIRVRTNLNEIMAMSYDTVIFEALADEDLIRLASQQLDSHFACCALSELALRRHPAVLELASGILTQSLSPLSLKEQAITVLSERDPAQAISYLLARRDEPSEASGLLEALLENLDFEMLREQPELWGSVKQLAGQSWPPGLEDVLPALND